MKKQIANAVAAVCMVAASFMLWPVAATASGSTSAHQFMADVNDDGYADAVTFDPNTGDWWVALSNGTTFGAPSRWISGFGVGSSKQFLSDTGGGFGADAVTFDARTGDWWVAISNEVNGFEMPSRWISGHGAGSTNQFMADVNGDTYNDAVVFFGSTGDWYAAESNGSGFTNGDPNYYPQLIKSGFGVGSSDQFMANINGDGTADAVTYDKNTGDWWTSASLSTTDPLVFSNPWRMVTGFGVGSSKQFLKDVNGDFNDDLVTYDKNTGDWWVWLIGASNIPSRWIHGHGVGSSNQLLGDVNSDGYADATAFFGNSGSWYVSGSNGSNFVYPYNAIAGFGVGTN